MPDPGGWIQAALQTHTGTHCGSAWPWTDVGPRPSPILSTPLHCAALFLPDAHPGLISCSLGDLGHLWLPTKHLIPCSPLGLESHVPQELRGNCSGEVGPSWPKSHLGTMTQECAPGPMVAVTTPPALLGAQPAKCRSRGFPVSIMTVRQVIVINYLCISYWWFCLSGNP